MLGQPPLGSRCAALAYLLPTLAKPNTDPQNKRERSGDPIGLLGAQRVDVLNRGNSGWKKLKTNENANSSAII